MAEFDNPRGALIAERWFVGAQALDGRRKDLLGMAFSDPVDAGFFANLYTGWDPETGSTSVWRDSRPMYGSEAWINSDAEAEQMDWERQTEEDRY